MLVPVSCLFCVLLFGISRGSERDCGRAVVRRGRIVGGELAEDGEFPWSASLLFKGFHYCGASVLSTRWILTAAHCLTNYAPDSFAVRVGKRNSQNGTSGTVLRVERIILHPKFSMPFLYAHDIALVLLTTSLDYGPYVQPVCLPDSDVVSDSSTSKQENMTDLLATAVGWGYVQESSTPQRFSAGLRKVQVPIVDYKQCQEWYALAGKVGLQLGPSQLCAGYKSGGKDACLGDSGGPLTLSIDGRHTVVGVISAGIGCARPLLPGIYTRVSAYTDWINNSMEEV